MEEFIKNLHIEIEKYPDTKNICIHEPKCYIQKYIDMYNETTMYS